MADTNGRKKITAVDLKARKGAGEKIVAVTAYDYTTARLVDELVDVVLVGDSVGMVVQGESTTLPVTVEHMIYHGRAVAKGLTKAHLVVDMPFMSYQASARDALRNAGRVVAEGHAQSVKVEGGVAVARTVEKLVAAGIPVMGHVGMTPQCYHVFGGFKVQGRSDKGRQGILHDAAAIEAAGAYALVLESVPSDLAREITRRVKIPTIGIGAGAACDGQVLVSTDLLGMNPDFTPRFVKRYADLAHGIRGAVAKYAEEVRDGSFPAEEHAFK